MTGFAERRRVPISKITVGSLQDLGYVVDMSKAHSFSREDLGECCQYCSGGTKPCPGHMDHGRDLAGNKTATNAQRQRLSDAGQADIMNFARQKLSLMRRERASGDRAEDPLLEGTSPGSLKYVGGDFIHVLYQEGDEMFGVGVTWDMTR